MENAVEALKIAFAVMVFTIALSVTMATFSQARETSEIVLYMSDKTNYYSWEDEANYQTTDAAGNIVYKNKRIVGIETIIPTLYRYYKENYTVVFVESDGVTGIPIYDLDSTDKWSKNATGNHINYFDLNSEIKANCPWVGTVNDIKKNLDLFLKGTTLITDDALKSFGNINRTVQYSGFIDAYADDTFLEELGEYSTDRTYGMNADGNLEIINDDGDKTILTQLPSGQWNLAAGSTNNLKATDGSSITLPNTLENIATKIGSSSSTFLDPDSGEIIELSKPTIKRVIKYTLQ